jgi:hypothetical protein
VEVPYAQAIDMLNTLPSQANPLDKLNTCLSMMQVMKTAVIEYHKNKAEIAAMDDELPI